MNHFCICHGIVCLAGLVQCEIVKRKRLAFICRHRYAMVFTALLLILVFKFNSILLHTVGRMVCVVFHCLSHICVATFSVIALDMCDGVRAERERKNKRSRVYRYLEIC